MATITQTVESTSRIRVAAVFEDGRVKPVWFEEIDRPARDRIFIKQILQVWTQHQGAAKLINYSVSDGSSGYVLSLNCLDFIWRLYFVESSAG